KIETRIALESENNAKMKLNLLLENQIKNKRQILHCQEVVGPILKNLFDSGIGESEIVAMKSISDLLLNHKGNDMAKLNVKPEVIMDLSSYSSNSKLEKENIKLAINFILNALILNAANFGKLQNYTHRLNLNESSSSLSINNSANWNDRNQVDGVADSII
ncbi:MAG TPA: hypothetical protein VFP49_01100, partial [Nitrososphaeraceae archaeon]|nr:hypothetical protein [Nitrososphaeraceae archaeon]